MYLSLHTDSYTHISHLTSEATNIFNNDSSYYLLFIVRILAVLNYLRIYLCICMRLKRWGKNKVKCEWETNSIWWNFVLVIVTKAMWLDETFWQILNNSFIDSLLLPLHHSNVYTLHSCRIMPKYVDVVAMKEIFLQIELPEKRWTLRNYH